ncbi:MAG: DegT/DnrJ/EryC1/StrS family aminotransferase, partial [Acidobacteria bacterium]|nr:DegT/DnrJ/EryC1/StrS family aminotransferase [Acidobacteriota bacterium]
LMRNHGSPRRYEYAILGTNSRLDSIQAAILDVKLRHLDAWTEGRRRNAKRYDELISALTPGRVLTPFAPDGRFHIFNQYTLRVEGRHQLRAHLASRGIPSEIYYPYPLHLQPAFAGYGYGPGSLPATEKICSEVVSLPIYPELPDDHLQAVVAAIAEFC